VLQEQALDLLEAGYSAAEYEHRGGRRLLLTLLDGDVALSVGLNPTARDTPEWDAYRSVVNSLLHSGAVEIPDIPDQLLAGTTVYEITPRGEEILREAGRIT
jgi:hypothetical protein